MAPHQLLTGTGHFHPTRWEKLQPVCLAGPEAVLTPGSWGTWGSMCRGASQPLPAHRILSTQLMSALLTVVSQTAIRVTYSVWFVYWG